MTLAQYYKVKEYHIPILIYYFLNNPKKQWKMYKKIQNEEKTLKKHTKLRKQNQKNLQNWKNKKKDKRQKEKKKFF